MESDEREKLRDEIRHIKDIVEVGGEYFAYKNPGVRFLVEAVVIKMPEEIPVIIGRELRVPHPLVFALNYYGEDGWGTPITLPDGSETVRYVLVEKESPVF